MNHFDLFVSHNSKDQKQIELLAEKLLEDGSFRCWLDVWSIPAASNWESELNNAMQQCAAVAITIGRNGWGPYHRLEAELMIDRAAQESGLKLVPVLLDGMLPKDVQETRLREYDAAKRAGSGDVDAVDLIPAETKVI